MSEQMQQKEKPEGEGNVTLTMQEAEALANAVFNGDLRRCQENPKFGYEYTGRNRPSPTCGLS